jgi:pimeloyl-ACP methyl ester carboxylesterase
MRTFLRRFALGRLRRAAYSPAALRAAFPETARIPDPIRQSLTSPQPWQLANMLGVVMAGEMPCPPPRCPTLLLWGEADRLDKVDAGAARQLADSLPGAQLVLLPGAGHLPQLDKPREFVAALDRFIAGRPDRGASRP